MRGLLQRLFYINVNGNPHRTQMKVLQFCVGQMLKKKFGFRKKSKNDSQQFCSRDQLWSCMSYRFKIYHEHSICAVICEYSRLPQQETFVSQLLAELIVGEEEATDKRQCRRLKKNRQRMKMPQHMPLRGIKTWIIICIK